ncbi:MAG TPA: hypothetical protein DCQ26_19385 [Marinilabiliales bacterium]|nr:MAG: hypothetical protein A2W97_02090 [Bacteroidetes bacterium GWE2_40_63]OFY17208.1 MAG: hypothetical protein A2W88_14775 [Bacteroidetes bacterium GWF2_40_13]HAN00763.1 hypothetical protein [Marinilabiliales bacterium]HBX84726.1 hypothetical protein [Marinilabiliales bacterium]HBY52329.1 hypothetical protein [Marinilabiliales bacterium]
MKINKLYQLIVSIALLVFVASCVDNEFDAPPAQNLPDGQAITIGEIYQLYNAQGGAFKFTDTMYLYATVIADEGSGNFYKNIYIQDNSGGINIKLQESASSLKVGDSVKIVMNGLIVSKYSEMMQLDSVKPAYDLIVLKNNVPRQPEVVTIDQLADFSYTCKLIQLNDVQFAPADTATTFANGYELVTMNHTLMDCDKNTVIVRTSGYANFADVNIPNGKGTVVAVVSRYNTDVQLYIRDVREVNLDSTRCGGVVTAARTLSEDFNTLANYGDPSTLDGWQNYMKTGTRGWQAKEFSGNIYVQASGYNSGLAEMETWLITPPLDFSSGDRAIAFESAIAYWTHTSGHPAKVMISTDFTGTNYTEATWTNLNATLAQSTSSNYTFVASGETDLSAYTGTGYISFVYVGSSTESTSFCIDNFKFGEKGTLGGSGNTGSGTGTYDDPYDVEYAIGNNSGNGVWVKGYLVGVIETVDASGNSLSTFVPSFTAPFNTATNVMIAQTASETDTNNCVIVQLPSGAIRDAVNLNVNPTNQGKEILLYGNLETYFSKPGLKTVTGYWLNGTGIIPEEPDGFFIEEFATTLGQFTGYSVSGTQVWEWASYGSGCAKMSGYSGGAVANEDWLVSPAIDLTSKTNVVMTLSTAANYIDGWDKMQVLVSDDYSGDVATATWTEFSGYTKPTSFTFVDSGEISLTAFEGKTIYVAFKYVSTGSAAATWEIGTVVLKEKN